MLLDFNNIFHPELRWANSRLTACCPCEHCDAYEEYSAQALYGTIAERQYAELPKSCDTCMRMLLWFTDCLRKLAWYEDKDEALKVEV